MCSSDLVNIGCVRMTERHRGQSQEIDSAAAVIDIDAAIRTAHSVVPFEQARTLVAVAGSATTVAAMALDLPRYDRERIHLTRLTRQQVTQVSDRLLALTADERRVLPFMHPGRVDVIPAGALILRRIMDIGAFDTVVVSEHDILDGIAWEVAQ